MDEQPTSGVLERAIRWYFVPGPKPWLSSLSILATNLLMLYGVLFLRWDVFAIMFLYWAENVIIGVYNVFRLALAKKGEAPGLLMAPIFCLHYGVLCFGHGVAVFIMFGGGGKIEHDHPLYPVVTKLFSLHFIQGLINLQAYASWISFALLMIVINQGAIFIHHYLIQREYRTADTRVLFWSPYVRIFKLHVVIMFAGFLMAFTQSSRYMVSLIILGKMLYDLRAYWLERTAPLLPAVEPSAGPAALKVESPRKRKSHRRRKGQRR